MSVVNALTSAICRHCRAGGSRRVGALRTAHLEVERLTPLSLSESVCALQWHSLFMSDVIESEWMALAPEPVHQKRPSGECGMLDDIFSPPSSIPSTVNGASNHTQLD